jgi:hypothetical protein
VAVQLGIMMNKPTYVFNQVANNTYPQGWYKWDNTKQDFMSTNTPVLTKNFAGIGTSSSTTEAGKQAIRDVYTETFKSTQPATSAVKPEFLLNEETLSYFKSGVDQGIEAIKKQYEERLKNLEYLSKKTALSGITQDEYDKKVNYINAEYNKKISQVGKMRYRINLESARDIELAELKRKYEGTTQPSTSVQQPTVKPKGKEVKDGIFVNEGAISKEEQLELFNYLKPFLEEQAAKTNKGKYASKMIGLGLRWDYKVNNPGRIAVNIPDVINPLNKPKYGYYTESINGQPLGEITNRFREIISKATGFDMSLYDGAIINLYDNDGLISTHNDVDESRSAINYPVIGVNLGGTGNFSIESRDGNPMELNLDPGTTYVFGVNGVNREVFHRTFPKIQSSFLPELTTKLDNKTYEPGSYRVTITMRRVMPIQQVSQSSTTPNQNDINNLPNINPCG